MTHVQRSDMEAWYITQVLKYINEMLANDIYHGVLETF